MRTLTIFVAALTLSFVPAALEQENPPSLAQVVALDECDPVTFNAALGPDFCRNVALGAATKLSDLFAKAAAGTPDPGWDFEPDTVCARRGDGSRMCRRLFERRGGQDPNPSRQPTPDHRFVER